MKFSPEFALALQCCRWNFPPADRPPIHPPKGINWSEFLRLVDFHRIQGLVWASLVSEAVPDDVASSLSAGAKAIAASNLKMAAEAGALQDAFGRENINLLFFKGLTLSALAYGDPFVKMSSDIDILVQPQDIERSAGLLRDLGFEAIIPRAESSSDIARWHARNKESAWIKRGTGTIVELHSRLADSSRLIPGVGMGSPRQQVSIGGRWILPTLATDELLSYLFVHGAGSAWFRLKWISDLGAILLEMSPGEVERTYRVARASQAGRAPAQALLLASGLFGIDLVPALHRELQSDPVNRFLARVAMRELLRTEEPTTRWGGTAIIRLTRPLLLEGWRFAVGEVNRQIQEVARWRTLPR